MSFHSIISFVVSNPILSALWVVVPDFKGRQKLGNGIRITRKAVKAEWIYGFLAPSKYFQSLITVGSRYHQSSIEDPFRPFPAMIRP